MRVPATILILVLAACAPPDGPPAGGPAGSPAGSPASRAMAPPPTQGTPLPGAFGAQPQQRPVEPAYDPFDTGAMGQYPAMPQQVPPAFRDF